MKNLTGNKAQNFINDYLNSSDFELWHVYGRCSDRKYRSFEGIKDRMRAEGGEDIRILSHNSNYYTCAYRLNEDLIVDTYANTYIIKNFKEA